MRKFILISMITLASVSLGACRQNVTIKQDAPGQKAFLTDGQIYDLHSGKIISSSELLADLATARHLIIGEKHDNAEHHQIELWLIQNLLIQRPQGSVLLEMLTSEQQPRVNQVKCWLKDNPVVRDSRVQELLNWQKGWSWEMYGDIVMQLLRGPYPPGSIGVMAAVSGSSVYSNFSNGSGINSKEFGYDKYMKQNPKSQLYKMDIRPDEFNSFELSARTYENKFTRRDITSDDYYIKYHYTPFSELIDFNVTASTSRGNQKYRDGSLYTFYKTSAQNRSDALDINNTSRFTVADNDLEFMLGSKLMRTRYDRTIHSAAGDPKANQESIENNPFAPSGQQDISALYTGLKVTRGIWEADFNLNYTRNRITGHKPACDSRVICVPQGSYDIDDKVGGFNPSVQLSAQVTPWLQPFIGYSKSMRAPNIQEMFFSNSGGASMNPFLKPERAETWQAGFNIDTRDLVVEQDALRFKALAYRSRIQNYIYSESYLVCSGGRKCSMAEVIGNDWEGISDEYSDNMYIYVNSASDVIAKGFELEMDYDAGFAFGRLSFSQQQTDQPTSIASTYFGAGDMTELPRKYMTLDTGVRFFDNALTLGTIIKYTGKARRLSPDFEQDEHTGAIIKQDLPQIPTIIDLYGTYEYNRNLTLKLSVQNLMNRDYSEALNKLNMMPGLGDETHPANSARGRTWIFGGDIRF